MKIDHSLERLTMEENIALETNNATYLKGITDMKLAALQAQQQMIEQQLSLYQAYSTDLSQRQNRRIQADQERRARLDFYLDNNLLSGATDAELSEISAETGFTPAAIRQAQAYRLQKDAESGKVSELLEYQKARDYIAAHHADMSFDQLLSGLLENTKLGTGELQTLLKGYDYGSVEFSSDDMSNLITALEEEFTENDQWGREEKNKMLDFISKNKITFKGKKVQLTDDQIAQIKEAVRSGAERFFPFGD